jgi:serine protease
VRVSVAITHPYRGDLRVVLVSPTNRERVLSDRAGGSFDDLVLENVDVTSLVTGAATGTWRLRVTDGARSDTGALNQWSITVE